MSIKMRNRFLIIIFLSFVFVSSFGCCYSFVKIKMGGPIVIERGTDDSILDGENSYEFNDGVKLLFTQKQGKDILQNYEVILNKKVKNFTVRFFSENDSDGVQMTGESFGNIKLFLKLSESDENFTVENLEKLYNTKYMSIIRGRDGKSYLAVMTSTQSIDEYLIFDDNLNCINKDEHIVVLDRRQTLGLDSEMDVWYRNDLISSESNQIRAKLEDDKIYYLKHVHSGDCLGKLEDRIYSIENGILKYVAKKTFGVVNVSGICQ